MSGDLEDFLRRAAQRRQAKSAQQPAADPQPRQRPQYTNHRTERIIREDVDEVLTAELVDDGVNAFQDRIRQLDEARRVATLAEAEANEKIRKLSGQLATAPGGGKFALTGHPARDVIAMLQRPGGIAQAILLREILERPQHRW